MSGTLFEELKKKKEEVKKERVKFLFTIITTNIFIALLCLSFKNANLEVKQVSVKKTLHSNYKMINIPLDILCEYQNTDLESPISLVDKNHRVIIQKAYLHGPVLGDSKRFKIEIHENDLLKLSADSNEAMIAIPEIKVLPKRVIPPKQRISKYEINI